MSIHNLKIISRPDWAPTYLLKKQFGHKEELDGKVMCLIRFEFSPLGNHSIEAGFALCITQYFEVAS